MVKRGINLNLGGKPRMSYISTAPREAVTVTGNRSRRKTVNMIQICIVESLLLQVRMILAHSTYLELKV